MKPATTHLRLPAFMAMMIVLVCSGALSSLEIPALYQCHAVRLNQVKNGRTHSKAFQVQSLFIRINRREVRVFGMHSQIYACEKLAVRRIVADTLFLDRYRNAPIAHNEPKIYIVKDTLMGNVNLFESDTSEVNIKVLVKKLIRPPAPATELERQCR